MTGTVELRDENRRCSRRGFAYLRCGGCGHLAIREVPADLGDHYRDDYYRIPTREGLERLGARSPHKLDIVRRHRSGGRLLEIGPAFGVFAHAAARAGFDVSVIEMDARCCEFLSGLGGIRVTRSDRPAEAMASLPPQDVIALWHVIEHLPDPMATLDAAAARLAPGGALVVATPNPRAWQAGRMGRRWPHLDAPRHLHLVPASGLVRRAEALGLRVAELGSDDPEGRTWNAFGWQRLLMNRFRSRWLQRGMWCAGTALAALASPLDRRPMQGAAYTAVLVRPAVADSMDNPPGPR